MRYEKSIIRARAAVFSYAAALLFIVAIITDPHPQNHADGLKWLIWSCAQPICLSTTKKAEVRCYAKNRVDSVLAR